MDGTTSNSHQTLVLRSLLRADTDGLWLTMAELAADAGVPERGVGSRVRDLRCLGFNIKRAKRPPRGDKPWAWEYRLFPE